MILFIWSKFILKRTTQCSPYSNTSLKNMYCMTKLSKEAFQLIAEIQLSLQSQHARVDRAD